MGVKLGCSQIRRKCRLRGILCFVLIKYYYGYQIKKKAMGGSCSGYGRRGEVHTEFWCGNLMEGDHL